MTIQVIPLKMNSLITKNFTYLVKKQGANQCIVVDPTGDMSAIESSLVENRAYVSDILITHSHHDHIGLVVPLVERYSCRAWISSREAGDIPVDKNFLCPIHSESDFVAASIDVIPIATPGHTLGSICYLIGSNLFTGDTLFIEGCGMCFGSSSDPYMLFESLKRLKKTLSANTKIFPAHSFGAAPGERFDFLLKNNIYLQFADDQQDLFVSFRMRSNQRRLFDFK